MIELQTVNIGNMSIRIPVWEQQSKTPGKTIVVTAGMDGDEYAGIEAAYELIRFYSKAKFAGRLVIIPIVNIPGFDEAVSFNPLDKKYPKYIYPGNENGSSTERLIHFLSEEYISKADVWIDLHGGALIESLNPFVWTHQTKNEEVNVLVEKILTNFKEGIKIYERNPDEKAEKLARQHTAYILLESGHLGERNKIDIGRHVNSVKTIIRIVREGKKSTKKGNVYTKVNYYIAAQDGLWYPSVFKNKEINKGALLGETFSFAGKRISTFKASQAGVLLWWRKSLNAKKGEVMVAIASEETSI